MIAKIRAAFEQHPWLQWVAIAGVGGATLFILVKNNLLGGPQASDSSALPSDASVGTDATGDPSLTTSGTGDATDLSSATMPSWLSNPPSWYTHPPADTDTTGTGSSSSPSNPTKSTKKPAHKPAPKSKATAHPVAKHPARATVEKAAKEPKESPSEDFSTGPSPFRSLGLPASNPASRGAHTVNLSVAPTPPHTVHPSESAHRPAPRKPKTAPRSR